MNTEELRIKTYSTSIKNLPDYPSDAGYTAQMLKEAFDARTDNEIKEKHNALVDSVNEELLELSGSTVKKSDINKDINDELSVEQMLNPPSTHYATALVERLEAELGTMPNYAGHSEKMVTRANTAFHADEAAVADKATKDGGGRRIHETYATKTELSSAVGDISSALDELHNYAQTLVNGGVE